jgi:hypothetical protein
MLNFVENLLENERGPMNDQDLTKTDYDPDRSLVLIEGLSHFLTNFLQNLASCQTSLTKNTEILASYCSLLDGHDYTPMRFPCFKVYFLEVTSYFIKYDICTRVYF